MGVDRRNGKLLWRVPLKTNAKRHAATPIIQGNSIIVNSHTFGLICFEIVKNGDSYEAREKWANRQMKINLSTPALSDGFLFSQGANKNLVCVDASNGSMKWQQAGFGKENASTMVIGQNLLVLTDDGQMFLIAAKGDKYEELGRAQVCGKNWNFPAFSNGKLYVRDSRELACFEMR